VAVQVWLARVPVQSVYAAGMPLQRVYSSWDFFRELAALMYYGLRGWLCSCCSCSGS
jgi:hypothetical protein